MKLYSKIRFMKFKMAVSGHTVTSLAKTLDVGMPYVSAIVNGKKNPSPVLAKRIADALDVEITDIFEVQESIREEV